MPSGSVTWLGSKPDHVQYGDLLTGPGTPWYLAAEDGSLTGWDEAPANDSGTVLRAQQHGGWPGRFLAQTRTITMAMVVNTDPGQMDTVIRQLEAGTDTTSDTELPLIVQLDDTPLLVWARCTRRAAPPTRNRRLGLGRVLLQFEATDPRRYALTEQAATTSLPAGESGLNWGSPETGLAWGSPETGLAWGVAGSTGNVTCTNSGATNTHPVIQITGPCTTPSITLVGTNTVLEYGLTLGVGEVLVIDCWAGTVTLGVGGQDRLPFATARSAPEESMTLPPGATSTLAFRSADIVPDPAASATVRWRSAYW